METYKCSECNYSTQRKTNLDRHFLSSKHKEKVQERINASRTPLNGLIHKCNYCDQIFSKASNLTRHNKSCYKKLELVETMKTKIQDLEKENKEQLKSFEKENENLKNIIEMLTEDKEHYKFLINNAGSIVKTSVNTLIALN
jgi:uncharacterized Zn-finger protein